MPGPIQLPKKGAKPQQKKQTKTLKRKRDEDSLQALERRVQEYTPENPPKLFSELPITRQTASALDKSHFKTLTDIQSRALPLALKGRDVLGAAKTGSGKTLAFLIPVLEILFRRKWTSLDGVGALIISPTRELATQIFEVLRKVGREHMFSAGLVIGGKSLKEEKDALHRMNIVVCTPGRMLQHMDQTYDVSFDNLQLLVLDEADRILDMGFKSTLDAIVANLPKDRQTLLFSATQTKNVSDLARLSLSNPEYVAVHEASTSATPAQLEQFYMVIPLQEKLDFLYSFLRNHTKTKLIVFLSSCKQVRFVNETFSKLQPGIPLLHLHGKQKQSLRADITAKFTSAQHACLFATDVVARGLDFPAVDWVVQLDCPEDADTYIHRVGRTARYEKTGRALLFLCPSEEAGFKKRLEAKKVPIVRVNPKASKKQEIKLQLQGFCFKDPELKYLGQKAFVSYARSLTVQKDKETFDIMKYPLEEFASSLGLPGAPRIRGLKNLDAQKMKDLKNLPRGLKALQVTSTTSSNSDHSGSESDSDEDVSGVNPKPTTENTGKKQVGVVTKHDRLVARQNQSVLAPHYRNMVADAGADSDDDDEGTGFLSVKRVGFSPSPTTSPAGSRSGTPEPTLDASGVPVVKLAPNVELAIDSKRREKLVQSKKALAALKPKGQKLIFDEDGEAHELYTLVDEAAFRAGGGDVEAERRRFEKEEGERLKEQDVEDREMEREKRREKKEKRREREREIAAMEQGGESGDESDGGVEVTGSWMNNAYVPAPGAGESEDEEVPDLVDTREDEGESKEERRRRKKEKKERKERKRAEKEEGGSDGEGSRKKKKRRKMTVEADEPETLEDLERLASGLLG